MTNSRTTLHLLICAGVLLNAGGCVVVDHEHAHHYYHPHHEDAVIVHVR